MTPFRADLHLHSTCSDGRCTPEELVRLAKQNEFSAISITDHDTIEGFSEAFEVGKKEGVLVVPGIEFSALHLGESVHILAYDFDFDSAHLKDLCKEHQTRRKERNHLMLEKLAGLGMKIDREKWDLWEQENASLGRPHMAQLLLQAGYVQTMREAFQKYLKEGAAGYVAGQGISVEDTIEIIHRSHGKAFLAHPHLYRQHRLLKKLMQFPWDGLECFYGKTPLHEVHRWKEMARSRGWLISGGSDFHGFSPDHAPFGSSWVSWEFFMQIFDRFLGRHPAYLSSGLKEKSSANSCAE